MFHVHPLQPPRHSSKMSSHAHTCWLVHDSTHTASYSKDTKCGQALDNRKKTSQKLDFVNSTGQKVTCSYVNVLQ